jgi:hypothetical protein
MLSIILSGWTAMNWLYFFIAVIAFLALIWFGIKLSRWVFNKFLYEFFHEGERKWEKKDQ